MQVDTEKRKLADEDVISLCVKLIGPEIDRDVDQSNNAKVRSYI